MRFLSATVGVEERDQEEKHSMFGDTMDAAPHLRATINHSSYSRVMIFVSFFRVWLCFQYDVLSTELVDSISLVFMLFSVLEVAVRVFAFSWHGFWVASNELYAQTRNRFDFCVAVVTVFGYILSRYSSTHALMFTVTKQDPFRVVLAVPMLRLLSSLGSLRVLFLGLAYTLPQYVGAVAGWVRLWFCCGLVWRRRVVCGKSDARGLLPSLLH